MRQKQNGLDSAATDAQALTPESAKHKEAKKIMPLIIGAGNAPYGSVIKLQWLRAIAGRCDLGRVTLAACIVIADMADSKTGICWPSLSYLARACGTSDRHIKKCISQAIKCNLVTIAEHGNRVRSNRYRINLDIIGSDLHDTTRSDLQNTTGSDPQDTRVVICSSEGSDPQVQDVVMHRSPESIHISEQQAKDRWEGSQAEGGAQSLRANRPSHSRHSGDYSEFWQAVGTRSTVHQSEQLIREYIADGVDYAAIVDGAKRWRAYNEVTGGKNATSPLNWLKYHKWEDDWKLKDSKPKSKAKSANYSDKPTEPVFLDDGRVIIPDYESNPQYIKWQHEFDKLDKTTNISHGNFEKHFNDCPVCQVHKSKYFELEYCKETSPDYLCALGINLYDDYRKEDIKLNEHYQQERREWKYKPNATITKQVWDDDL